VVPEIPLGLQSLRDWIVEIVRQEVAAARPEVRADPYMTTSEAAQLTRVTVGTVRRWIADGRLRKHGSSKRILVSRTEVERLVREDGKRQPVLPSRKKRAPKETPEQVANRLLGLAD
jgi:excisionase family DNA binding protein